MLLVAGLAALVVYIGSSGSVWITPNFVLGEFFATTTGLPNRPTSPVVVSNIYKFATEIMQPIREELGKPITITSGYRSPEVNTAVGGSKTSAHLSGLASDFVVTGLSGPDAFALVQRLVDELPIDQLIYYTKRGHIHVAMISDGKGPRRMVGVDHDNGERVQWLRS